MTKTGNKLNSVLNGEWAIHIKGKWKRMTSKLRRTEGKQIIKTEVKNERTTN